MNGVSAGAFPSADPPTVTYRIRHETHYKYSSNVAACQNQLRIQPVSIGNVLCKETSVRITPEPTSLEQHCDYFGNLVQTFSIEGTHRALEIVVESTVTVKPTQDNAAPSAAWESVRDECFSRPPAMRLDEYRFDSPRIVRSALLANYASDCFVSGGDTVACALELTKRIHREFKYDTTATTVDTATEAAFGKRAGVCQDFAHVQIACLRSMGLPARYVSGYLRTIPPQGQERLVGADESHAWLEIYAGPSHGWVGLDPTNGCLVNTDHIPICVGRDYSDVSPMRGVVLGGGTPTLVVKVDVHCLDSDD